MEISYNVLCEKNPFLKTLQNTFQILHFDTALAGGCLRDTLLDKPIADYDVFYCGTFPKQSLSELGFVFEDLFLSESYEDNGEWELTHQAVWQGKKIQFIKCKNTLQRKNIITKFPNSIGKLCMYWNHLSPLGILEFKTSVLNKQIVWDATYVNQKYVGKILMKYNDWSHHYLAGFTITPFDNVHAVQIEMPKIKKVKAPPKKYLVLNSAAPVYKEYSVSME